MRFVAYGLAGIVGLAGLFLATVMIVHRHPALPGQVEAPGQAVRPPATVPAAEAGAREDRLRELQRQLEFETSVLAALRAQANAARQDLANLQQQKDVVRTALADLQHRQDAARAGDARQPSQRSPAPLADVQGDRVVTRQGANVRAAPNKDAAVQRVAARGTVLQVFGRSRDGWVQVGENGPWGWIYASLLDPAP
jgi:hypothetical protein